jgi:hypothetical protein
MEGILPYPFLDHFSALSEAVDLLRGDCITKREIGRAEVLLESF